MNDLYFGLLCMFGASLLAVLSMIASRLDKIVDVLEVFRDKKFPK
jgi:hypothetical protein